MMLRRIAMCALLSVTTAAAALDVPLTVTNRSKEPREYELASGGVPLPMGAAKFTANCAVADAANKAVPAQFTVLNRWPADGSIRWMLVQFPAKLAGGATAKFTLRAYKRDNAEIARLTARPKYRVRITDRKDSFLVDTGVMRFTVKKRNFALFDTVTLLDKGRAVSLAGPNACGEGFVVRTVKNEVFSVGRDPDSKVTLEDVGPLRATIKAEGRHKDAQGNSLLDYQVRIYAYAGSRAVRVQYVFTRSQGKWPKELTDLKQISVTLTPKLTGKLQRRLDSPDQGGASAAGARAVARLSNDGSQPKRFYEGPAVVSVSDATGAGVGATVRWFWQLRPNSMEVAPNGALTVNLIDARRTGAEPVHFYPGMSKTSDLLFHFTGPGAALDDPRAAHHFQQPLFVKCQPSWYCQKTLSLGRLVSADYKGYQPRFQAARKVIENGFAEQIRTIRRLRKRVVDRRRKIDSYHIIHFGDGFHHFAGSRHQGVQWDNCYYMYTHLLAMQYARTADDLYLDTLREAVTFEGDIAVVWHRDRLGAPRVNPGAYHIGGFSGWRRFSSATYNFYKPIGMLELFYLTGDRRHQEAGLTNLRWMLSHNGYNMLNNPRSCGAGLRAAVHGYLATGNTGYLYLARRLARYAIGMHRTYGHFAPVRNSIFMAPNALEGLCVYHELTGDPELGRVLPDMVRAHYRRFSRSPRSLVYGYMNLYVAALAGDNAFRDQILTGLAGLTSFGVRRGNHAVKDFAANRRAVPLMMWYLTDLAARPTPWAGRINLLPYPADTVDCPRMRAPRLDGTIGANEWANTTSLTLVYDPNPRRPLVAPTRVRIGHDLTNLYIAVEASEPRMNDLRVNVTQEGGPVYTDDCVELYISPVPRRFGLKLIINAVGIRATGSRGFDRRRYQPPTPQQIPVRAGRSRNGWTLEVAVPLARLGLSGPPRAGTSLGFNCIRFRTPRPYEGSTWTGCSNENASTGTIVLR